MLRELRSDVRGFCEGLCGFTAADWQALAAMVIGTITWVVLGSIW